MTFTTQPELITGVTDFLNAVFSVLFFVLLLRYKTKKSAFMALVMFWFAVSALIGAFVHSFELPDEIDLFVWKILPLFMCLTVSTFAACLSLDFWYNKHKIILIVSVISSIISSAAVVIASSYTEDSLAIYTAYALLCLTFVAVICAVKLIGGRQMHYLFYLGAIATQVIGVFIRANTNLLIDFFILINCDSLYHIVSILTLALLYLGCAASEKSYALNLLQNDTK